MLARAVGLDMVQAGWKPTVDNLFRPCHKASHSRGGSGGKGEPSAQLIDHLKKGDMAKEAERLLDGSGLAAGAAAPGTTLPQSQRVAG